MRQPRNELDTLIRHAASAQECRTIAALAQRIGVSLRTMQGWQHSDKCPEHARLLLVLLAGRALTFEKIAEVVAEWKAFYGFGGAK